MWQSPFTWAQPFWKVSSMGSAILWHLQIIKILNVINVWIWTWRLQNATKHWEDLVLSLLLHYCLLQKYEVKRKKKVRQCVDLNLGCSDLQSHAFTLRHTRMYVSSQSSECKGIFNSSDLVDFKVGLVDYFYNYQLITFKISNTQTCKHNWNAILGAPPF